MKSLAGYQLLAQIYDSKNTIVYRALREDDRVPVVLKTVRLGSLAAEASDLALARYRQEYEILQRLGAQVPGVIRAEGLLIQRRLPVLVIEDCGGRSLRESLPSEGRLPWPEGLAIAVQVAEILAQVHAAGVIHKDLNPGNLLLDRTSAQVKLIDFGIATCFARESPSLEHPRVLEGTLAYISPEQTGRTNCPLDHRSDLYSLGVTLYELLSGQLPFVSTDPLDLVHSHLARQPLPPTAPGLPPVLAEIVLKLMAKSAAERYQSAAGLAADLRRCQEAWQAQGRVELFPLGQAELSDRLVMPDKLYGRSTALAQLERAFLQVTAAGEVALATGLTLVLGPGGMGKSALVQHIHGPLSAARGHLAAGKFDPLQRNVPYAAIATALSGLVRQIFRESEARLNQWRERLALALGNNGQIALDFVPELAEILGPQPPAVALPPTEALNRFNLVLQNLLGAFCDPQYPLVLFLDDLQWADAASLKLLHQLLAQEPRAGFFALAAYRDDEVHATHPLSLALEKLRQAGVRITEIRLDPLSEADIAHLLGDAIGTDLAESADLVQRIAAKTSGNPFFVTELIKALHRQGVIAFDYDRRCWRVDLSHPERWDIPDNVVELALVKFRQLPPASQRVLQWAACMGNAFNLDRLAVAAGQPARELFEQLAAAITAGFVLPQGALTAEGLIVEHRFAHDRLQQAAYESLSAAERSRLHWQMGHLLLADEPALTAGPSSMFRIADHLNAGIRLLATAREARQVAQVNLRAGQQARAAAAYDAAARYLHAGLQVLPPSAWDTDYDLALALHQAAVEASYLTGQYPEAARLAAVVLAQARSLWDQLPVYQTEIQFLAVQNQMAAAIELGLQVLDRLGIPLRQVPPVVPDIDWLDRLPALNNANARAALDTCLNLFSPLYISQPERLTSLNWTMLGICTRYGNSAQAAFAYASYGVMLGADLGQVALGYEFGCLALRVLERFPDRALECKVRELFHAFIQHWGEPVDQALEALRETIQVGLDTGDFEFAGYAALHYGSNLFLSGQPLAGVASQQAAYVERLTRLEQAFARDYAALWAQVTHNWQGRSLDPCVLSGHYGTEATWKKSWEQQNIAAGLFSLHLNQGILSYSFGDAATAIDHFQQAKPYAGSMAGLFPSQQLPFYEALALLAVDPARRPPTALEQARSHQHTLQRLAHQGAANFQHKYELVTAELARVQGDLLLAEDAYERAIQGASDQGYLHEEALAWELAGRFYGGRGRDRIAQSYGQAAYQTYARWGAEAKLVQLEALYPRDWLTPLEMTSSYSTTIISTTSDSLGGPRGTTSGRRGRSSLDLAALVQAAEAISQEIDLDRLLDRLMRTLLASAGAQSGRLLLPQEGNDWVVAARGDLDPPDPIAPHLDLEADPASSPRIHVLTPGQTKHAWPTELPASIIYYVARSREPVVIDDASQAQNLAADPYWLEHPTRSVLCYPLLNGGELAGLVYLENNLAVGAFTSDRLELLQLLSGQAAIALAKAQLYRQLRDNEQRLAQFLEAMPLGVFVTDAQGKPYYANQTAIQILGQGVIPEANLTQLSELYQIYRAGTEELYPSDCLPIARALRGESHHLDDLEINPASDPSLGESERLPLEVWGTPIVDNQNQVRYAIAVFQNIRDRRQAEAERQAFAENLAALNRGYARFVPQQFLQFLNKQSITEVSLNDQVQQEMSVLFADIRDFTQMSEQMTPRENFRFINAFLSRIGPAIREHQGFIDKYMGDGIMALFAGGADGALQAALAMQSRLVDLNQARRAEGEAPIALGIGINTGPLMLGIVGEASRLDGTAIGDAVNLASRLEQLTKQYGVRLLVTQQTVDRLADPSAYALRNIGTATVKGKSTRVTVYEVFAGDEPALQAGKLATLPRFAEAIAAYDQGELAQAAGLFAACLEACAGDCVAQFYLDRCRRES